MTGGAHEDALREVGYSKERRVDPQIVVGLLVDRTGFPLEIGCFEGNKAGKHAILPIIGQFQARHGIEHMVVVADTGMLSAGNLAELDAAGPGCIVGSRAVKAPIDLESHFRWHGESRTKRLSQHRIDHGTGGTGEAAALVLRPGNAGSNTAADHITAGRLALTQIPTHLHKGC